MAEPRIALDQPFQEREWQIQRAGWVLMALVLAAAVLGVFGGGGIFAHGDAASADGRLSARFERFGHVHRDMQIHLDILPQASDPLLRININREFLDALSLHEIDPPPESVESSAAGRVYVFRTNVSSPGPVRITLNAAFEYAGRASARVSSGKSRIEFDCWVYP